MRLAKPVLPCLLLILALPAISGGQTAPQTTAPTLKVYSRETIVDVTVTDSKGNPVHGLTRDDFTVKEDNKPQPIRSFEEFSAEPARPLPNLPPNVYSNMQPPPTGNAVDILLLDGLNTAPADGTNPNQIHWSVGLQTTVKKAAAKYLKSTPPDARVAVLGLSRGLRILQGFSSDPNLLSAAVDGMDINMDGRATTLSAWCAQLDTHNRTTLEALNQIAASVTSIKGRKNLIWFSAGFPTLTDPNVNAQPYCEKTALTSAIASMPAPPRGSTGTITLPPGHGMPDYSAALQKTYSLLAAAQVAVFPIGAGGLVAFPNPVAPGWVFPKDDEFKEVELSFESMAEATGGTAFYNSNDLASLVSQAVDKGANYYTLTYAPPGQKYDYAHHSIKISVNQPGFHLVYRESYDAVDPTTIKPTVGLTLTTTPPAVNADYIKAAMSRSIPTSQDILFDVKVEPSNVPPKPDDPPILGTLDPAIKAKLKDKPLARYGFQYTISASQIVFTPGPNGTHKGALELDLAAYDADGKLITGLSQTVSMPLNEARYQEFIKGPFRFFQQIDLPPGQLFLRIGVLDPTSNKVGALEIPLTVPKR
jgi:VWFA-related protein